MTTQDIYSIQTTGFAAGRHFDPDFAGTKIGSHSAETFDLALRDAEIIDVATEGFVKHVLVRNFTDAMSGVVQITDENRHLLVSEYKARRESELPVLTRWFPAGSVEVKEAEWLHLVLYSAPHCAKEGIEIDADWGIVSINAGPTAEVTPLGPASQMRNAMGIEQGGNGKPLDPVEYARGVAYWNDWATVG
jgi:hypothetical protein